MAALPDYVQQRRQGLYAVLEIPKALRGHFGKRRFVESLQTRDPRVAARRVLLKVAEWRAAIERAKGAASPAASLLWEALAWKKILEQEEDGDTRESLGYALGDWLEKIEEREGTAKAIETSRVVYGTSIPLSPHIDAWLASIQHLSQKTIDAHARAVRDFLESFKSSEEVTEDAVKDHLTKLRAEKGWSDQTVKKQLSFFRSFIGYFDDTFRTKLLDHFAIKSLGKAANAKTVKQRSWLAFTGADVSQLYEAVRGSQKEQDQILADLIALGAYTGCRIEELGQIKTAHVTDGSIHIADAKTAAGIRELPIHPAITGLVARLVKNAQDGFLIHGTAATYDKRTNALGTRFGRLKRSLGYGERHVFHSIRKTVVSQLEQAGINENVTADIVGHEKPRITYGLYSAGTSLKQKAEALSHVSYGGLLKTPA